MKLGDQAYLYYPDGSHEVGNIAAFDQHSVTVLLPRDGDSERAIVVSAKRLKLTVAGEWRIDL